MFTLCSHSLYSSLDPGWKPHKQYCGYNNKPCVSSNTIKCVNDRSLGYKCICKPGFEGRNCQTSK